MKTEAYITTLDNCILIFSKFEDTGALVEGCKDIKKYLLEEPQEKKVPNLSELLKLDNKFDNEAVTDLIQNVKTPHLDKANAEGRISGIPVKK